MHTRLSKRPSQPCRLSQLLLLCAVSYGPGSGYEGWCTTNSVAKRNLTDLHDLWDTDRPAHGQNGTGAQWVQPSRAQSSRVRTPTLPSLTSSASRIRSSR